MRTHLLLLSLAATVLLVTPGAPAAEEGSGADCVVKGKGIVEKGVFIYSAKEGGTPIAGFATQEVALELSDIPADTSSGRAKIKTVAPIRIEGWVEPTKIPLSTKGDVAIAPGHVWIGRGEQVKLKGAQPGKLKIETTITATQQKLKANAACNELAVGRIKVDEFHPPETSKKWVLKHNTLDLYDDPNGTSVFTIEVPTAESGVLLYSSDPPKSGFVHVQHGGSLVIEAWARQTDLKAFPKGEMLDALGSGSMVSISPAKLKVDGSTKEVTVDKDVAIRLNPNDGVKPIGTVESGTKLIVVDTVGGWSRIYPKGLEIIPPDGKDFWAKAKDLGL